MGRIMGVKVADVTRKVALVRCSGHRSVDADGKEQGAKLKGTYEGFADCLAASKVGGNGPLACKFGCLGYGNCVKACQYDAIHIVGGVAKVDNEKCQGCMACAAVCPRKLIIPVNYDKHVVIACNSHAKGAVTVRGCSQGCIGCGMCIKICPHDAIHVENNLAVNDYEKCTSCGLCAAVCPKKLIASPVDTPEEVLKIIKEHMKAGIK
jgi:ferredoxin